MTAPQPQLDTLPPRLRTVLWHRENAGKPLHTSHHLFPGRSSWVAAIIIWAFLFLLAWHGHNAEEALSVSAFALVIVLIIPFYGFLASARFRSCERAIVLDILYAGRSAYIVPFATIDPASFRVHTHWKRLPYRYKPLLAKATWAEHPAMAEYVLNSHDARWWTGHPTALNVRGAPYSKYCISFRGLHPVLASPAYRAKAATGVVPARTPALLAAYNAAITDPDLRDVVAYDGYPAMRWCIGTSHPEKLLRQIEDAMTRAGAPGAAGLTDRALADVYDEQPRTIPADPALW
jgi:hypothetical protein